MVPIIFWKTNSFFSFINTPFFTEPIPRLQKIKTSIEKSPTSPKPSLQTKLSRRSPDCPLAHIYIRLPYLRMYQVCIFRRRQQAKRRKETFEKRQQQSRILQISPSAPPTPLLPVFPPYRTFLTLDRHRHGYFRACARILDLIAAPYVRICPKCKQVFI